MNSNVSCLLAGLIGFTLAGSAFGASPASSSARDSAANRTAVPALWNPALPASQRVHALIAKMTLEEKAAQLGNAAPAIPRLGVPEYNWWNEGLHGVARAGIATVFPQARMRVAFVTGLQGDDAQYLKTIATSKHFAVHSGPESTRHEADVHLSAHDLEDTYLPAFRATVMEGKVGSVMCAYNAIDGEPACANQMLLEQHLRQDWGFKGYVVSDCGAAGVAGLSEDSSGTGPDAARRIHTARQGARDCRSDWAASDRARLCRCLGRRRSARQPAGIAASCGAGDTVLRARLAAAA